jgi:hypothetical protein
VTRRRARDDGPLPALHREGPTRSAAYLTYPIAPGLLEVAANMTRAAEENGVGAILEMSQRTARRDAASNSARQHWLVERVLDHFDGATTHIRPTLFAEFCAQIGFNEHFVQHMSKLGADVRNGITVGTGDNAETATGLAPLSVEAFVERNKAAFQR